MSAAGGGAIRVPGHVFLGPQKGLPELPGSVISFLRLIAFLFILAHWRVLNGCLQGHAAVSPPRTLIRFVTSLISVLEVVLGQF
jgi:hypothetical protein